MRTFYAATLSLLMCLSLSAQSVETRDLLLRYADDKTIFSAVDKQPEFPGGYRAMQKYFKKSLHYPVEAKKVGVSGRVFLSFIVREEGRITDVTLLKGLGHGCDEEAVRIVEAMPRWKPGIQSGQAVNVRCNLPILFSPEY